MQNKDNLPIELNRDFINDYDYTPGRVIHDIKHFDFSKAIELQEEPYWSLPDDFFCVIYPHKINLYVSWLPSGNIKIGKFIVEVTRDFDKEKFYFVKTRDPREMVRYIFEAHERAKYISICIEKGSINIYCFVKSTIVMHRK